MRVALPRAIYHQLDDRQHGLCMTMPWLFWASSKSRDWISIWWLLHCGVVMTPATPTIFSRRAVLPRQVEACARLVGLQS